MFSSMETRKKMTAKDAKKQMTFGERQASATSAVLGTYWISHVVIPMGVRWQLSGFSLKTSPVSTWFPNTYSIVFQNEFAGIKNLPGHAKTLWKGFVPGLIQKTLQANLRYPSQDYIQSTLERKTSLSTWLTVVLSGAFAAILEGLVLHPIDTWRNILIKEERNLSFKEKIHVATDRGMTLYNGLPWTLARNSIGGPVQFLAFALMMKKFFGAEDKSMLSKTQLSVCSFVAASLMVFLTMPFDNKKLNNQMMAGKPKKFNWKTDLFNFRGGMVKVATRPLTPALTMAVYNILDPHIIASRQNPNRVHGFFSSIKQSSKKPEAETPRMRKTW